MRVRTDKQVMVVLFFGLVRKLHWGTKALLDSVQAQCGALLMQLNLTHPGQFAPARPSYRLRPTAPKTTSAIRRAPLTA